ncbi:hypothetical protein [Paenibacillus sp. XY044]|uniref:hypothetical protein n=1 Tax=Paenibacillus sp. XY044 TaxID=2026089 RepID=UPI000B98C4B8|nr:hypothetical protein [Paenibacillus sp. XY044]OZB97909.1 hypothetical protein CJP46_01690 [Paenibacillus sp. XY044]
MGFYHLFWGFLFLFDFQINGFDILPDVIGYLLFYVGLAKLNRRSEHFLKAGNTAAVLLGLSALALVLSLLPGGSAVIGIPLNLVILLLNLYMVFHICHGIGALASRRGLYQFQNRAIERWRWYLLLIPALFVVLLIAVLLPAAALILGLVLIVASFVINVLMMLLMREAEHHLRR